MRKLIKYQSFIILFLLVIVFLSSCKKFYNADQDLDITDSKLYGDWYEYRSAAMGLYGLQQTLVEQLLLLGELRGDLLTVTQNADVDMIEINNFNVSKNNKYASPTNFFKLISACNSFIRTVKSRHPEVLDPNATGTNFDRLYGEALCMRAWAYFNAARIYGKVPYLPEDLSTKEQIEGYVNSTGTYKDSVFINYNPDGSYTTTKRDTVFTKQIYDLDKIIDIFTSQLENSIKEQSGVTFVGVDYAQINKDITWEVTTWHPYGMHALLGQMYLTRGNLAQARNHFQSIVINNTISTTVGSSSSGRYDLSTWANGNWAGIFTGIDNREHIYTIWFSKEKFQQNQLQNFFINKFMLKPTLAAISKWEQTWWFQSINRNDSRPEFTTMTFLGFPGDQYRGYLRSYACFNGEGLITLDDYSRMLTLKSKSDFRGASAIMDGADTAVVKYYLGKSTYSEDANYIIYRAAGIHLYLAELYIYWVYSQDGGAYTTHAIEAQGLLNDGAYTGFGSTRGRAQLGVRGRVGLANNLYDPTLIPSTPNYDAIDFTKSVFYFHDPNTNKIIGYRDFTEDLPGKAKYLEDKIMNERALELAFEGERFYDLMRVAKRRNDPSYLASKVSVKYPAAQREAMYNLLMNPNNWYINYFN